MSSATPFPYLAPWQTGFVRYSTQQVAPVITAGVVRRLLLIVPTGEYWRVIGMSSFAQMTATVGTRGLRVSILNADFSVSYAVGAPASLTANAGVLVTASPQTTTFANMTDPTNGTISIEILDVLLSPGMMLQFQFDLIDAADTWQTAASHALVEVYTEDYQPAIREVAVAQPRLL